MEDFLEGHHWEYSPGCSSTDRGACHLRTKSTLVNCCSQGTTFHFDLQGSRWTLYYKGPHLQQFHPGSHLSPQNSPWRLSTGCVASVGGGVGPFGWQFTPTCMFTASRARAWIWCFSAIYFQLSYVRFLLFLTPVLLHSISQHQPISSLGSNELQHLKPWAGVQFIPKCQFWLPKVALAQCQQLKSFYPFQVQIILAPRPVITCFAGLNGMSRNFSYPKEHFGGNHYYVVWHICCPVPTSRVWGFQYLHLLANLPVSFLTFYFFIIIVTLVDGKQYLWFWCASKPHSFIRSHGDIQLPQYHMLERLFWMVLALVSKKLHPNCEGLVLRSRFSPTDRCVYPDVSATLSWVV